MFRIETSDQESTNISTLLDNEPINEANNLLNDCSAFINLSNHTLLSLPFQAFNRLRNWRVKRRDNKLAVMYDSLIPRLQVNEQCLRSLLSDVIEKKNAIRLQAFHLLKRLSSCIIYNKQCLDQSIEPLQYYRDSINSLSNESSYLKAMINFNSDILRCQHVELVSKGKGYIPWNNKQKSVLSYSKASSSVATLRPLTENDLACDDDHPDLISRLKLLRESKQKYVDLLSELLQKRETYLVNLNNTQESYQVLTKLLTRDDRSFNNRQKDLLDLVIEKETNKDQNDKKKSSNDGIFDSGLTDTKMNNEENSMTNPMNDRDYVNEEDVDINKDNKMNSSKIKQNDVLVDIESDINFLNPNNFLESSSYDHSRCTDCSLGYMITKDCINNLQLLFQQAKLATEKLQSIVEYRERMNEIAESLDLTNINSNFDENDMSTPSNFSPTNANTTIGNSYNPSNAKTFTNHSPLNLRLNNTIKLFTNISLNNGNNNSNSQENN